MLRESPVEANDRHTTLPGLRWPGGRHVAVVLNVACEVWSQGQVSGVGPMGNPLPPGIFDTNADSYGRYGAVDGIRRLMRKLEQAHATADIFTSGALAERKSQLVKAIADAGHGIVGHGYTQDIIHAKLSSADDEKYVRLATKLLTEVTSRDTRSRYRPPSGPTRLQMAVRFARRRLALRSEIRTRKLGRNPLYCRIQRLVALHAVWPDSASVHRHIRGYTGGYSRGQE